MALVLLMVLAPLVMALAVYHFAGYYNGRYDQ